jgi:hypothetical protein
MSAQQEQEVVVRAVINTLQEPFQSAESPETSFADGSKGLLELKEELLQRGMSDAEAEVYLRTL